MDPTDYAQLAILLRGAEKALLSGTLNDWQHANTTSFHVLASAIIDINDRLAQLETSTDKSLVVI